MVDPLHKRVLGTSGRISECISGHLEQGLFKTLPLRGETWRAAQLYMIYGQPGNSGPATRLLAKIIREHCGHGRV